MTMSEVTAVGVEFVVTGLVLNPQNGRVVERHEFLVPNGYRFKAGRNPGVCDLKVPKARAVSGIAAALQVDLVPRTRDSAELEPRVRLWCRQAEATGYLKLGDGSALRFGSTQELRPDTRYEVSLFTPAPAFRLEFRTPAGGAAVVQPASSGTLSATISGPVPPGEPPWQRVVLLAVLLDRYPELCPERNGVRLNPSDALYELGSWFCGMTSPGWYIKQLDAALMAAGVEAPANTGKQARVAAHYAPAASPEKLQLWKKRIAELGILEE